MVKTLYDQDQVAQRVDELAAEIAGAIEGPFVIVGLLKGAFVFLADLVRALDRHGATPEVDFMWLSSYGRSKESSGEVRLLGEPPAEITGRQILLVDDIQDTARTLAFARNRLLERGASRVWTCALLDKPSRREVAFAADFTGFEIEDVFVVGYGIDYAERYRHLPYIGMVD